MKTYDSAVKVTYNDGSVRTLHNSVTCHDIVDALRIVEDDEGYGWPEKTAKRETLYIIKVSDE